MPKLTSSLVYTFNHSNINNQSISENQPLKQTQIFTEIDFQSSFLIPILIPNHICINNEDIEQHKQFMYSPDWQHQTVVESAYIDDSLQQVNLVFATCESVYIDKNKSLSSTHYSSKDYEGMNNNDMNLEIDENSLSVQEYRISLSRSDVKSSSNNIFKDDLKYIFNNYSSNLQNQERGKSDEGDKLINDFENEKEEKFKNNSHEQNHTIDQKINQFDHLQDKSQNDLNKNNFQLNNNKFNNSNTLTQSINNLDESKFYLKIKIAKIDKNELNKFFNLEYVLDLSEDYHRNIYYDKTGVESRIHKFKMHFNDKQNHINQKVEFNNFYLMDNRKKDLFWRFLKNLTKCGCNQNMN